VIREELCQAPLTLSLSPLRSGAEVRFAREADTVKWGGNKRLNECKSLLREDRRVNHSIDNSAGPWSSGSVTLSPLLELHQTSGCYSQPSRISTAASSPSFYCAVLLKKVLPSAENRLRSCFVNLHCISLAGESLHEREQGVQFLKVPMAGEEILQSPMCTAAATITIIKRSPPPC